MPVLNFKRRSVLAAAAAAALPALRRAQAASPRPLLAAASSDVLTLDPSMDTSPVSLNLFKGIFDQLTDIDADGSVRPQLATSWSANADATSWTFQMRGDARFHDGTPVTAADVVWSYQKVMGDPKSPVRTYLGAVAAVEARGPDTIVFTLKAPFAPFDRQVSLISIMPQRAYETLGPEKFALQPVGSGPYRLVRWVRDDRVELQASPDYWAGMRPIERVVIRPVPSDAARAAGLLSGELDIVQGLPPALVARIEGAAGARVAKVTTNRVVYLGFDVNVAPLNDLKVRQAVDCAIDRQSITDRLLRGMGKPAGQVVAPMTFGYDPAIAPTAYDPEKARSLLKTSAYRGERIAFQYASNRTASSSEVAQAVAGYLQAAGINIALEGMEYAAFFPLWLNRGLHGMHMFAYGPSIMDSDLPLGSLYASSGRGYWTDSEVDALVKEQRAEPDPAKRKAIISRIWRRSQEVLPYSILYDEGSASGIRDGVVWTPRPDERLSFADARFAEGAR